jgi:transposase InsO family protein
VSGRLTAGEVAGSEALMSARSRKKKSKPTKKKRAKKNPLKGKRYTPEQREHTLVLVASGMSRAKAAESLGATEESVRRWVKEAKANGTMPKPPSKDVGSRGDGMDNKAAATGSSPYRPKDPGQGLADYEEEAILKVKEKRPSYQPAQVRTHLKRFKGWRIAVKAIAAVFKKNGYEVVHRGSRPQGPEPIRFEAPHRGALWQMDFAEVRIIGCKLHILVALDDFSRFCVGHALCDSPSTDVAVKVLRQAISRHGKPEAVRTDRGGAFLASTEEGDFARVLGNEMIDHIVGRAYHPQGGGKVESLIGTIRRELWDVEHFDDRATAQRRLAEFLDDYNERRAHMGIDGLTPADRFHGRADRVLATINAISRKRQGSLAPGTAATKAIEEVCGADARAPVEVLRLCIVDGQMELRFCGARLPLGRIRS